MCPHTKVRGLIPLRGGVGECHDDNSKHGSWPFWAMTRRIVGPHTLKSGAFFVCNLGWECGGGCH